MVEKITVKDFDDIIEYVLTTQNICLHAWFWYIDKFLLLIAPESVEKIKCTICAYEDFMVFSFASVIEEKDVENKLKEILENNGIEVQIEGNEVL